MTYEDKASYESLPPGISRRKHWLPGFDVIYLNPPKKLLGNGIPTPPTVLYLTCIINSELKYFPIFTHLSEPGLISAYF